MVEQHLERRGISDRRVLDVMRQVPRHEFVDGPLQSRAYEDSALPIGQDQTISQPWIVARMTELLDARPGHRVLEIGTGSGYQAAVLSALVARVYTIERHSGLTRRAKDLFQKLGIPNIVCRTADGSIGWSEWAPWDRIIVTAGAPEVPMALLRQLAEGGVLVIPVGDERRQVLKVIHALPGGGHQVVEESPCTFVPLVGREGWKP
ncbi:MAG: protein-L-isoaspartate(D-aspartate) O-methyltransferase [Calditrichaeota bacterium]|nr:protein-L-isoaspartate(D-aspartate) O-methyltransferase [Candidatus Cloacimonadota bacterium]MCB1046059.1 protein-L-isoaspartate(D-aspartate) O-methyltransferase [Calditrichota bacterium]MCB9473991.1 protein-L-isoaspartate(D-aspartate) O-methyltransferase [Candidatus Delongbacteria bacterium]